MRNFFRLIEAWLCDDRKLLYITAALVVVGGLVRVIDYKTSEWALNLAFLPYFVMRFLFYSKNRKHFWTSLEKQRFVVALILFSAVVINFFTVYRAEFLLLILLMIDYLFVINNRQVDTK